MTRRKLYDQEELRQHSPACKAHQGQGCDCGWERQTGAPQPDPTEAVLFKRMETEPALYAAYNMGRRGAPAGDHGYTHPATCGVYGISHVCTCGIVARRERAPAGEPRGDLTSLVRNAARVREIADDMDAEADALARASSAAGAPSDEWLERALAMIHAAAPLMARPADWYSFEAQARAALAGRSRAPEPPDGYTLDDLAEAVEDAADFTDEHLDSKEGGCSTSRVARMAAAYLRALRPAPSQKGGD